MDARGGILSLRTLLGGLGLWLACVGAASAEDVGFNKERAWRVGREEADSPACYAQIMTQKGSLTLVANRLAVTFVVTTDDAMKPGREARLATDAYSFYFVPRFEGDNTSVYSAGGLNQAAMAALRLARSIDVTVDRRTVFSINVEGSGLAEALDGLKACAAGQSGWWGPGVAQAAADLIRPPPMNKEGVWSLSAGPEPGACAASLGADDDKSLVLIGGPAGVVVMLTSANGFPKGRKGSLVLDGVAYAFTKLPETPNLLPMAEILGPEALADFARAGTLEVLLEKRSVALVKLEGTGHAELLKDLAACVRGEPGWWGEGTKAAASS